MEVASNLAFSAAPRLLSPPLDFGLGFESIRHVSLHGPCKKSMQGCAFISFTKIKESVHKLGFDPELR
jgi:hypothetical protein